MAAVHARVKTLYCRLTKKNILFVFLHYTLLHKFVENLVVRISIWDITFQIRGWFVFRSGEGERIGLLLAQRGFDWWIVALFVYFPLTRFLSWVSSLRDLNFNSCLERIPASLPPPPSPIQREKSWKGCFLNVFFSSCWFRFQLSVAPQNIVPDEDLQPHLILRAKNGIVVNISPLPHT